MDLGDLMVLRSVPMRVLCISRIQIIYTVMERKTLGGKSFSTLFIGQSLNSSFRPATIYAFDVMTTSGAPFLVNRRLFAMAAEGFPDGIKCDVYGNVYSGCGDGVEVWNPAGTLVGRIIVDGGVANFCFGKEGEMFLCNEQKLWRLQMARTTKGALLGV